MRMTLYRADTKRPSGRAGEVWTEDPSTARAYSHSRARVYTTTTDVRSVSVDIASQSDWDRLDTPSGRAAAAGDSDWIDYFDQDETGRESTSYRLARNVPLNAKLHRPSGRAGSGGVTGGG